MSATIDQLGREAVALGDRSRAILGIAGCPEIDVGRPATPNWWLARSAGPTG
jgi:hypothetical protein